MAKWRTALLQLIDYRIANSILRDIFRFNYDAMWMTIVLWKMISFSFMVILEICYRIQKVISIRTVVQETQRSCQCMIKPETDGPGS